MGEQVKRKKSRLGVLWLECKCPLNLDVVRAKNNHEVLKMEPWEVIATKLHLPV